MIQKKVCMVGAFATGKTSLVARFVKGIYSDKYQTTIGVKIDKKVIATKEQTINMILWDIYGEDEFQKIRMSYLRGASGYILVIDGTRRETLSIAIELQQKVADVLGNIPFVAMVNKLDLTQDWELHEDDIEHMKSMGWDIIQGSAKTGIGVEVCFNTLSSKIVQEN